MSKNRVDAELDSESVFLKEPISRLQTVEDGAVQAMDSGDHERALFLRMQKQALALAKLCFEDPTIADREVILAKAHLQLSSTYHEMGLGDQAYFHAQKAMERCDPRRGAEGDPDLTVTTLLAVARSMIMRGDSKCVNFLQRALVINHDNHGEDDISNSPIHEAFGDFYIKLGDCRALMMEAEENPKKGRSKRPVDPKNNMGILHIGDDKKPDDYEKAMDELGRAWELIAGPGTRPKIMKRSMAKNPAMAPLYSKMAKTRGKQGEDEDASKLYERGIECQGLANNPNNAAVANQQYELGVTYHKIKKYNDSIAVLDKAAKYCEEKEDIGHSEPLRLLVKKQQAITLYDGNEVAAAKTMFEELMSLQRKEYGGSSVIVAETLKYLGDVNVPLKNNPAAKKYYSRALRILRRRLGPHDDTVKHLLSYIRQLSLDDQGSAPLNNNNPNTISSRDKNEKVNR